METQPQDERPQDGRPQDGRPPEDVLMDAEFLARLVVGIGEVAEITGVPQRKLRYWQEKGIIRAVRSEEGATRRFDYVNVKKVLLVKELLDEGYRLDAAAEKVEKRMEMTRVAFSKLASRSKSEKS